ncbi:Pentatricopeptide repeat-containing protein [Platanthera guangdongensis]|uniref:Pentatricopeptide repeat-containing protein n=1 Tax=Platanthera guangdongensis TaxID=2320717 RepID=A0ABR2N1L6_9ASPA
MPKMTLLAEKAGRCGCVRLRAIREGRQVQAQALKDGLITRLALASTCVHLYAVCREIDLARQLFDEMPERSSVSWNAMLAGYCVNGFAKEALLLFKEMVRSETRMTKRTSFMLLFACSQIGDLALGASSLFHAMSGKNVITWSTMATALAIHGQGKAVMELMNSMEKVGISPNAVTFTSLLSACGRAGLGFQDCELWCGEWAGLQEEKKHLGHSHELSRRLSQSSRGGIHPAGKSLLRNVSPVRRSGGISSPSSRSCLLRLHLPVFGKEEEGSDREERMGIASLLGSFFTAWNRRRKPPSVVVVSDPYPVTA